MSEKFRWLMMMVLAAAIVCARPSSHIVAASYAGTPYSGTAVALPGTIQAEDFDNGGEGVAYHDTDAGNNGGAYRSTNVDIGSGTQAAYAIGWTDPGEWLNYTVRVAATGTYNVVLRVASPDGGGIVHVGFNGATSVWAPVTMPATGGWGAYTTVSFRAQIAAGTQQMTLYFDTGGMNVDSIAVSAVSTTPSSTPYSGTAISLPGTVRASDFDNGGEGVAYHDTDAGNNGGVYRSTDVDVQACAEGGYNVGWIGAGEWLNYSVNVAAAGTYTVQLRVASLGGGTLHVGFNNATGTSVGVPATGGWQNWTNVSFSTSLSAGPQLMTLYFDTSSFNVNTVTVSSSSSPTPTTPTPSPSAPSVTLTAPSSGSSYTAPATLTISANASTTSGSITKVDFYAGSTLVGTDTTSPYSVSWSNVASGTYSLMAKATSSAGLTATSSTMSITVNAASTGGSGGTGGSGSGSSGFGIVLDDFSGPRANPGNPGVNIFSLVTAEDSGQSFSLGGGSLTVTGGNPGIYWQFQPYPYIEPKGYMHEWIEQGSWPGGGAINRMRWAVKCSASVALTSTGYGNVQIGTYYKPSTTNTGDSANQGTHAYHMVDLPITAGHWVYLTLTRFYQHQVGKDASTNWPEIASYYDQLTRFYFDTQDGNWGGNTCTFQPITLGTVSGEPDSLVQGTAATYDGTKYQVTFPGPKLSSQQYTVRYSTQSMKANGFASGTSGGTVSATGNSYTNVHWSSAAMAQPSGGMYIAIQPNGQSAFTEVYVPSN